MRSAYAAEDSSSASQTAQRRSSLIVTMTLVTRHLWCSPRPGSAQSALKTCHENGNFPIAKYLVLLSLGGALARHQTVLALSPVHRSIVAPNVSQERGPKFINYEEQVSSFSDMEQ